MSTIPTCPTVGRWQGQEDSEWKMDDLLDPRVGGEFWPCNRALRMHDCTPEVYFWRTSTGAEVDFVVDTGAVLVPIEVKTSSTPRPAMASGIVAFRELLGTKAAPGYVVHAGEVRLPLAPGVTALPFAEL